MKRLPLIPTIVVALAVAAMIGLGLWQLLDRLPKKEAYLAQLATNPAKPPVAFPRLPDDRLLFRRSSAMCLEPVSQRLFGAGAAGYRVIATCRDGVEGPGFQVQLGTTRDPRYRSTWRGGAVRGTISHAPDARPLLATLFDHRPQTMLLVADTPPPGLAPNARPDLSSVPNNHLSYAVQWFFFAAIAAVIYGIAVSRRRSR
ncbi:SURF1 family protein [Sphingomonas sp. MA1305]|uniref:SURF1 family cytochrome oxidase biogenesis protein n=1 Tax=Sphingomonas sp. MA1305 TaxID=2479204 RepID=UPI0018E04623|nr:SURF1 family protein [Sphingomonas sp. MA1305]MBI0475325.1 SURF1 family protein [Sphingomonas sp. MA1305]